MVAGEYADNEVNGALAAFEWLGARARWSLAICLILGLIFQEVGAFLRPALPVLIAGLLGVSMMRVDLASALRAAFSRQRLWRSLGFIAFLTIFIPTVLMLAMTALGVPEVYIAAVVYAYAAPPIASAAALSLLAGLNAVFTLEVTILASFLVPLTGPLVVTALLGEAVPMDGVAMGLRLAGMIAGGTVLAIIARALIGAERIADHGRAADGFAALLMIVTLFPLVDGATAIIVDAPLLAFAILGLVTTLNLGLQFTIGRLLRGRIDHATAGAAGLVSGNRNVALFLAALPDTPIYALFVALYQVPMYITPLIIGRLIGKDPNR